MIISNPCAPIITMSLGGYIGNGAFITATPFSLVLNRVEFVENTGGGGGAYFGPAWNVSEPGTFKDTLKPVDPEYYLQTDNQTRKSLRVVAVDVDFNGTLKENTYVVYRYVDTNHVSVVSSVSSVPNTHIAAIHVDAAQIQIENFASMPRVTFKIT